MAKHAEVCAACGFPARFAARELAVVQPPVPPVINKRLLYALLKASAFLVLLIVQVVWNFPLFGCGC
ncbi:hypothetical protein LP419_32760 [Massilia sp. H-1]|nr:hypothetical protein LP419_32760 [Massilia sp. H-1]